MTASSRIVTYDTKPDRSADTEQRFSSVAPPPFCPFGEHSSSLTRAKSLGMCVFLPFLFPKLQRIRKTSLSVGVHQELNNGSILNEERDAALEACFKHGCDRFAPQVPVPGGPPGLG